VDPGAERLFTAARSAPSLKLPHTRERRPYLGWVILFVGLLIGTSGTVYYGFFATGRYVTEMHLTVRSSDLAQSGNLATDAVFGLGNTTGAAFADSFVVAEYLRSPAVIEDVGKMLDLRAMFSAPSIDPLSRFNKNGSEEDLVNYWRRWVSVDYDPITATITLTVQAFTPEQSLAIADAARKTAEALVNRMDTQARNDVLQFSQADLQRSRGALETIEARLAHPASANPVQVQQLEVDQDFAQKDYEAALQQLETAKEIAAITQRYLVVYVPPELATSPIEPVRWQAILIVWLAVIMVGGITSLFFATIREHLL
jgi:capsule polysaccharide export protein KpsE/RkpR